MKILVIGSGGREHAITWKLSRSAHTEKLYSAPGNAGICEIARCFPADVNDPHELARLAESIEADLTVIGPEAPLVAGVVDAFQERGLRIIGPSPEAARLEGSKIFAKRFMARRSIPTARFIACQSPEEARKGLESGFEFPVVIKADGLAAGKGVFIAPDRKSFDLTIEQFMVERIFGEAGLSIVLEECLTGREASLMIFTDGRDYKIIAPAQDYKRANDGDQGLNTGGMGSFSAPGLIDDDMLERITREIIEPTLVGMSDEGHSFSGILYAGLMLTDDGPKVIEFNVRMGDPETQAVLVRLESDLVEVFESILDHRIGSQPVNWSEDASVCVVAASGGYPGEFEKGQTISGIEEANSLEGVVVFHAGTGRGEDGGFLTKGGRVLGVTARSATLSAARKRAYEAISLIGYERMHYRKDIADTFDRG